MVPHHQGLGTVALVDCGASTLLPGCVLSTHVVGFELGPAEQERVFKSGYIACALEQYFGGCTQPGSCPPA